MPFMICVPGGDMPASSPIEVDSIAEAVTKRDALWQGSWGGQALVIVDMTTREVVRPCIDCRGSGKDPDPRRTDLPCGFCKGTGESGRSAW